MTVINMSLVVMAVAKSGTQGQALPYSLYAILTVVVGGALVWAGQQYFSGVFTEFGTKSADSFIKGLGRRGGLGGRQLRDYRRAVLKSYAEHALGGNTQVIDIRAMYVPLRYVEARERTEPDGSRRPDEGRDVYARIRQEKRSIVIDIARTLCSKRSD